MLSLSYRALLEEKARNQLLEAQLSNNAVYEVEVKTGGMKVRLARREGREGRKCAVCMRVWTGGVGVRAGGMSHTSQCAARPHHPTHPHMRACLWAMRRCPPSPPRQRLVID